ncbi:hypothetical protein WJX79_000215 [Trebouxia sp. C0005]
MRHRKWVTVVAFAAATAVGCIVVRKLRQGGKPASGEKQEPKRRTPKRLAEPANGAGKRSNLLCSHRLSDLDDSEAIFEQGGDDGQRSYVDALLLRAKVPRLELPAHRPQDAYDIESAVCPVSWEEKVTADEEAAAPYDAPVNMASPLSFWPDLTGDAQGPPVDRVPQSVSAIQAELPADVNSQQQYAAASQPLELSSAFADVVVPQEQIYQLQLEQATTESLRQSAVECVGRSKTPLETRAGADKDSPWGRLPHKFSHVRSIKGDGNCFYRAILAGMVEGLCLEPRPARIAALSAAFMSQRVAMESCPIVNHQTKVLALQGHSLLQDMLQGIGRPGKTWQDMLEVLNNQDMDQAMVQFLRAITATQMWANKAKYALYIVAIDAYRGFSYSYDTILQHETLRMTAQAEQMQLTQPEAQTASGQSRTQKDGYRSVLRHQVLAATPQALQLFHVCATRWGIGPSCRKCHHSSGTTNMHLDPQDCVAATKQDNRPQQAPTSAY